MKQYLLNIGIALSQLLHSILGGDPKVTTSARLGRKVLAGKSWAIFICKIISAIFFDPNHCVRAYEKDKAYTKCVHDNLDKSIHG